MILADKIVELRKREGLSQEELAQRVGVSRQSVSKWESAQSTPDMNRILALSELFGVSTDYLLRDDIESPGARRAVGARGCGGGKHINNALREELAGDVDRTVAKNVTVQTEGGRKVSRQVQYYSLDVILTVGYRVKSPRGVEFRRWATGVLHDYVVKGYAANKVRLHQLGQAVEVIARLSEGDVKKQAMVSLVMSFLT